MKSRRRCRQFVGLGVWCAVGFLSIWLCGVSLVLGAEDPLPSTMPDFHIAMHTHAARLTEVESDKEAIDLFVSSIGPALQLGDAARTLAAKSIPAKISKELLVSEITQAAQKLIGDLAAWHLATTVQQAVNDNHIPLVTGQVSVASTRREWLALQGRTTWLNSLNELANTLTASESFPAGQEDATSKRLAILSERASRLELDALQAAYRDWDRLRGWKDRVRMLRGQVRLCGTWQWVIHNHHQHHQEQKFSLLFSPPGADHANLPGLVETIVLGDNVYLRWEIDGRVQEDSLQFVKDGQRLEGTFVNSQGGWGSISGKRTASCTP
jgi:hypothetical protein